jgi:hypothetical protein
MPAGLRCRPVRLEDWGRRIMPRPAGTGGPSPAGAGTFAAASAPTDTPVQVTTPAVLPGQGRSSYQRDPQMEHRAEVRDRRTNHRGLVSCPTRLEDWANQNWRKPTPVATKTKRLSGWARGCETPAPQRLKGQGGNLHSPSLGSLPRWASAVCGWSIASRRSSQAFIPWPHGAHYST